jgi:L-alanine-DL-glutamate epimerase-like enolase superfamily enzyme
MDGSAFDFKVRTFAVAVHRAPISTPVKTSFGVMKDRPAVFLRVTDEAGRHGYGEVWCNFPTVAAEHRARLAQEVVGPLLQVLPPHADGQIYARLMERLHVLALQSGEWGPLRQVSAGFDAAIHDLAARRAGVPLYRFLGGEDAQSRISAYASGIGPETPHATASAAAAAGHAAFKVKVGFGRETDLASLKAMRDAIGTDGTLMADANQGWALDEALARSDEYAAFDLRWLEEPLRADRPLEEWLRLASRAAFPLAAGENVNALADFEAMMAAGVVGYIQPDLAKWGGISGCLDVARRALRHGIAYCPHFLGGGVGVVTSAHVLAAQGGDGLLEMDVNPNPLRDDLILPLLAVKDGEITLADEPGLGASPDHLFA